MANLLTRIFGSKHDRDIKKIAPLVAEINEHYERLSVLTEEELTGKTAEFRQRLAEGATLDDLLPEAFAVVKEACRRHVGKTLEVVGLPVEWNMVPFDVQLIGGIVLHQGKIAEMATGEGKTLVATLPTYLNALAGKGVHIVTVNDYLARRDSEWMGWIYTYLGLTVGCIQNQMTNAERRTQYLCDITFGTANEFGFDYLRDNMAQRVEDRVHRNFGYAIIDEVDSILIDEARTPLIISGQVETTTVHDRYREMLATVETLVRKQTRLINDMVAEAEEILAAEDGDHFQAGTLLLAARRGAPKNKRLLKVEKEPGVAKLITDVESAYMRDKKLHEIDDRLYFFIDEREHTIALTDLGTAQLTKEEQNLFELPDLSSMLSEIEGDQSLAPEERQKRIDAAYAVHAERSEKVHAINQLLRAYSLYEKDVEYVLQDGKVMIVDQFTGRILSGRRYSDGLHQAIEAKEGVKIEAETQTLATITLQNYFRMYEKLAGMTGTAETEAAEFWDIYKLDVTVIPTNKPVIRKDMDDQIFRTRREKYNAIIEEIQTQYNAGRPALVGTTSVEVSETLSRMLKRTGIPHNVLNAKQHQREAEIVAQAGQRSAVTIATNMAGRGTDIRLGPGVVELGGLHIIGTERHEARRIDRQLRGRAGRQGDPGSSLFFLSLEDDLMRLFGGDRLGAIMDRLGVQEGEVITHGMVTRAIERAQKKVEAQNFAIRKHTLEYDDVMNVQRKWIYERRLAALERPSIQEEVVELIEGVLDDLLAEYAPEKDHPEEWNWTGLRDKLREIYLLNFEVRTDDIAEFTQAKLREQLLGAVMAFYRQKEAAYGPEIMRQLERYAVLSTIDRHWRDHLAEMDELRTGIGLRAYHQGMGKPIDIYKREAFKMFEDMVVRIDREAVNLVYKLRVNIPEQSRTDRRRVPQNLQTSHADATNMGLGGGRAPGEPVGAGMRGAGPTGAGAGPAGMAPHERDPMAEASQAGRQARTIKREMPKVGRNDPCPCGSGKKYKKCHGAGEA
ncbi:MAG TPA: preprotein translocase subunit SecA [candidate division Zixibacteria bacterium]|nr:preprotein translocase subunit SecA [candidate division Zixibacteria bacterium]MDD4918259.1 preprotein translocase subunit SecA [candidate division Zixibacteria bacterium]HOD65838.1 preprotein translocase subunit SecA [candidate division Zixibacteria bacterium]HPM38406.1 preprotein translocase subunit SecA [candidate division Zixibacteria bacterium]